MTIQQITAEKSVNKYVKMEKKYLLSSLRNCLFTHALYGWCNCARTSPSESPEVSQLWEAGSTALPMRPRWPGRSFLPYFCLSRAVLMLRKADRERGIMLVRGHRVVHQQRGAQYKSHFPLWWNRPEETNGFNSLVICKVKKDNCGHPSDFLQSTSNKAFCMDCTPNP